MWLASVSRSRLTHPVGQLWPAKEWADNPNLRRDGVELLEQVLDGVGDGRWERLFRMCVTLCLHRGLSDEEIARLPTWWREAKGKALAGGPLKVYYSRGVPEGLVSCDPCEKPGREYFPGHRRNIWVPIDCGKCPPCLQRAEIEETGVVCGVEGGCS